MPKSMHMSRIAANWHNILQDWLAALRVEAMHVAMRCRAIKNDSFCDVVSFTWHSVRIVGLNLHHAHPATIQLLLFTFQVIYSYVFAVLGKVCRQTQPQPQCIAAT